MSAFPAQSTVDVHYGHLCTIRVSTFDIVGSPGARVAAVVFQVQANKTRACKVFTVQTPYESGSSPSAAVRAAWRQLTGEGGDTTVAQTAAMDEIKEFVVSETRKLGVGLALDIV